MNELSISQSVKISSGDMVRSRFTVAFQEREFFTVRASDRLDIYQQRGTGTPIGHIIFGSSWSGSIWKSGECIGEYFIDEDQEYAIIPIKENRKEPQIIRQTDPLLYLLQTLD